MATERGIEAGRLEFDLADRMRRALRISESSVQDMAEYLGVSRNTVGSWINGHIVPSKQTLRLWAMRTGVPFVWLETGQVVVDDNGPETGINTDPATRHARTGVSTHLVRTLPTRLAIAA